MGEGHQLKVKIDGKSPENFLKDKASSMMSGKSKASGAAKITGAP